MSLARAGIAVTFLTQLWLFFMAADSNKGYQLPANTLWIDSIIPGKQLALKYCTSCHLFPEPSLLDKKTWVNKVLPNMGWRLGIRNKDEDPYMDIVPEERELLRNLNIYPDKPMLSNGDWKEIVQYFEREAPDEPLPQVKQNAIINQLSLFSPKPMVFDGTPLPKTTLLKLNNMSDELYVGDAENKLYIFNNKFEFKSAWNVESAPVDIDFPHNEPPRLLTVGSVSPSDQKNGRLVTFDTTFTIQTPPVNIDHLPRPVQFTYADLDMDGKQDAIVCGFGNNAGKLVWYSNCKVSAENILSNLPGARKVEVGDFNKDGRPDIIVLMTQAWEGISIWYNQGGGKFEEKKILRFHPAFGTSYFELVDFNQDGYPDILLTNGDNWDYSRINKNYHGVRIYLNDGKYNFTEKWFFPLYGASKAIARDFDNDGDQDIAAISFYNNLDNPANGFVYFSNEGNFNFKPASLPEAALGKWLTMEAGDFDHDGDTDIVIGSYFHNIEEMGSLVGSVDISSFPQLLVLTNNTVK
ncbi:MAG: VCBS repeat-containing protein [Chitinophagaceae bacterium]|nr:VCBS repeat-containing protein [Chitinophagaceae bacterium]